MRFLAIVAGLAAAGGALGCERIAGLDDVVPGSTVDADSPVDTAPGTPDAACNGTTMAPADEGTAHVADDSIVGWDANPPTSGTHYDDWAHWSRSYTPNIPRGYLVHNLEHGGIVLSHSCASCDADIAELVSIMEAEPQDPNCAAPVVSRILVTPDPLLPVGISFAATAWGHSYTATCVNRAELVDFIHAYYDGPETPEPGNCADGVYPLD